MALAMAAHVLVLVPINPALLADRAGGLRQPGSKRWDIWLATLASLFFRKESSHTMNTDHRILSVEKPTDEMWEVIGHGIGQYNQQHGGPDGFQHLCLALYAPDGKVVGGLIGEIYWGWLYINLLFIREELRGQGYGHQLLTQTEEEARKRGATNAFFDTFSFQAPEFYKQHGYQVFGELKDFPPGHTRYYMTKAL